MALNTYTDLSAGLQQWMEDDDAEFQVSIPDVIDLGEKRLTRDLDLALFRRTDSTATMSIGVATVAKPTIASPDLLVATKGLYLSGGALTGNKFLQQRSHEYILDYNEVAVNAVPRYFAETDEGNWVFGSPPDATYTVNLRYLSRPERLSATNATNWLSDNCYDILFKACLAEAEKFLKDDERGAMWEQDYGANMPRIRAELYNQFGNQYDTLGATPQAQARRSFNP